MTEDRYLSLSPEVCAFLECEAATQLAARASPIAAGRAQRRRPRAIRWLGETAAGYARGVQTEDVKPETVDLDGDEDILGDQLKFTWNQTYQFVSEKLSLGAQLREQLKGQHRHKVDGEPAA